jgi:EmrB/QacA subfamily drug resistance transporter
LFEEQTLRSDATRLQDDLRNGYELAPLEAIKRLRFYTWLVVGTTCIGAFMGQLDASIVQLTLPALEHVFHTTLTAVSWVAIAYLLAFAAMLPTFARLSEMFGRKTLYMAGYVVFTVSSAMCGFVSGLRMLILFRLLQGVGGAMLGANSITIMVKAAGPQKRGRAMGMYAAAQAVGVSAGPVVGGLLLSTLGWRWVFWVSVPFGIAGIILGWLILPLTTEPARDRRFDWWGALLLTPALTAAVMVLSELQAWGPTSPALLGMAAATVILLGLFIWWEKRAAAPLIDLSIFRFEAFSGGVIAVNLSYALLYAMFFLMAFAFVRGYQESAITGGLRLAIIPVALGVVAPLSGGLYERIGARMVTTAGMALCAFALALLWLNLDYTVGHSLGRMGALAVFGVGLGMFIAPNNTATMAAAPEDRCGQAGGLLNLIRVLGCAIGVTVASTALSWRLQVLTRNEISVTAGVAAGTVLAAVKGVMWILGVFSVLAAVFAVLRDHPQREGAVGAGCATTAE